MNIMIIVILNVIYIYVHLSSLIYIHLRFIGIFIYLGLKHIPDGTNYGQHALTVN